MKIMQFQSRIIMAVLAGWVLSWPGSICGQSNRIAVRSIGGAAEFYHTGDGSVFYPRGFNYIQLVKAADGAYGESALFHEDTHDLMDIDDDFQRMAALGYNAVRVFIDLCRDQHCMTDEQGLLPDYVDNIIELLQRAHQYGIYVMLVMNWLPDLGPYSGPAHQWCASNGNFFGGNCLVMSPEGVNRYALFFQDLVRALKQGGAPMENIWAYELRNEFYVEYDQLPFTKTSGMVTTANGKSYNMASATEKKKMGDDAVVYWANTLRNAILDEDEEALVTCGFFTPNEPNQIRENDPRIVPFVAARLYSNLDFFDIHAYPGFHRFEIDAQNYGINAYQNKPVVLGEYGTFLPNAADEYFAALLSDQWQTTACDYGVDGFLYWTWDRHRLPWSAPDDPWGGSDEHAFIGKVLSPAFKPDPCKDQLADINVSRNKPTLASMEWESNVSARVVDGNATETPWIAGSDPPQWVEVDLEQRYDLESIQLVVETGSEEPHFYTHQLQVKPNSGSSYQTLKTFSGNRVNFEVLSYQPDDGALIKNVRFIRVNILDAPGWAALHELTAFIPQQRGELDVPQPPVLTFPRPGLDPYQSQALTWSNDEPNLKSELQIATDKTFSQIVEAKNQLTGMQYQPQTLQNNQAYYWRVRQSNDHGDGPWSVTGILSSDLTKTQEIESLHYTVFPNPAGDEVHVRALGNERLTKVQLIGLDGKYHEMLSPENQNITIDLAPVPSGLYTLRLVSGTASEAIKLMVLH